MASIQPLNAVINGLQAANDTSHSLHAKESNLTDQNKTGLVLLNAIREIVDAPQGVNAGANVDHIGIDEVAIRAQVVDNERQWQQGTIQDTSDEENERQWCCLASKVDVQKGDGARPHTFYTSNVGARRSDPLVNDEFHRRFQKVNATTVLLLPAALKGIVPTVTYKADVQKHVVQISRPNEGVSKLSTLESGTSMKLLL
ncbi:hypothetical protein F0562_013397 [Nyssa sinensis]|uniref:Uncharacterized protein n=1 Tax=Nyssa sinensis TaxID=561372 RepID=A0A5J4ZMF9_9ASTE|nr:hypothetical protein F0562_013397 [Nyssa sinensis]